MSHRLWTYLSETANCDEATQGQAHGGEGEPAKLKGHVGAHRLLAALLRIPQHCQGPFKVVCTRSGVR